MFDWSRNTTDDQKTAEGAEYERYFQSVLSILDDHFQKTKVKWRLHTLDKPSPSNKILGAILGKICQF